MEEEEESNNKKRKRKRANRLWLIEEKKYPS
jgi:hypothetical protein